MMLTASKRLSRIGDKDTMLVLVLEVAGQSYYFGDESADITNRYGNPTDIHVTGTNLVQSFVKAWDIQTDTSGDVSLGITDLQLPHDLAELVPAGEAMAGNRVELALLRRGEDWSQHWTLVSGTVENPTLMSMEAVENTISFSINQESGLLFSFPTSDYLVQSEWLSSDDTMDTGEDPETAFGLDPDVTGAGVDWETLNFLFSSESCVLTMPSDYTDSPEYVPFVFGRPGVNDDNELWKDLDGDGAIDEQDSFSVGGDERLRYFTTPGQTVAMLTLQSTGISDPDVTDGTALSDIMEEYGFPFPAGTDVDQTELIAGGTAYTFSHNDVVLWARVAIHAGKAAQVGTALYMVDRTHYGTPYSRSGEYTPELGSTRRGKPYTYVDIKADYSGFLELLDPTDEQDSGKQVYVVSDGASSEFHILGMEVSPLELQDAVLLWNFAACCWFGTIRSGANTADFLQAFFSNPEVQRIIEDKDSARTWQDYHMSCFNLAMDASNRYTIKYPSSDLDAHCPGSWLEGGGQLFFNGEVIENPADLIMFLCETSGLAYDKGSLFTLRDRLRNWKIGGYVDDATDVMSYITGVMQTYAPFTLGRGPNGITAKHWKWDATREHAVHHFVEGVDLECIGEGVVVEESTLLRSLRIEARPVTWLHQENQPYATTTDVDLSLLSAKELRKRSNLLHPRGPAKSQAQLKGIARAATKYLRELRSRYGQWDFSQSSAITEQTAFWRINNYTGDIEAANRGQWDENPLTFPVSDNEREQWSRFLISPLLVAAFRKWQDQDAEDLVLEIEDLWDLDTLQRAADSLIALRAEPRRSASGLTGKSNGWVEEGDVVRVTAPSFGLFDQVCIVAEKAWQRTNCALKFRPLSLPSRDRPRAA